MNDLSCHAILTRPGRLKALCHYLFKVHDGTYRRRVLPILTNDSQIAFNFTKKVKSYILSPNSHIPQINEHNNMLLIYCECLFFM